MQELDYKAVNDYHLGQMIKSILENKKITLGQLAEGINKSREYMHKVVKKKFIHTDILTDIANFLEIPITRFFIDDYKVIELNNKILQLEQQNKTLQELADTQKELLEQYKNK